MKSDTIIILGDFNCDLLGIDSKTESEIHPKTRRLLTLFSFSTCKTLSTSLQGSHLDQAH